MSNSMTNVIPALWSAAQIVPRELVGFLGACRRDFDSKGMAAGDTLKVPVIPVKSIGTYTPAMTTTAGDDTTPTTVTIPLATNSQYSFNLTGEEERSLENGGDNAKEFMRQNVEQGLRTICNEIEEDLWEAAYAFGSRAHGTAGTTPFAAATNLEDAVEMAKILKDNGIAPNPADCSLVIGTAASANLLKQITINQNSAGSAADQMRQNGGIIDLFGLRVRESGKIAAKTCGTGTGYLVNAAQAKAQTTIECDGGAGTILAGDVIAVADEDPVYKYVVNTAFSATSFAIGGPGVFSAGGFADDKEITVHKNASGTMTPNVALHRQALILVARPPIIPANSNIEQTMFGDATSGMNFLFCRIVGDGMTTYRLHCLYGCKAVQSAAIAILMG